MTRHQPYHPIDACRWSEPAFRPLLLSHDDNAIEPYWVCERTKTPVPVTQADCRKCRHWAPERAAAKPRRRRAS
jgi:hypothetical protein